MFLFLLKGFVMNSQRDLNVHKIEKLCKICLVVEGQGKPLKAKDGTSGFWVIILSGYSQ